MNSKEVQWHLHNIGWPIAIDGVYGPQTKAAVKDFQRGYAKEFLTVDGIAGPKTKAALLRCRQDGGRTGNFFTFREFASKGNGWIKVHRELVEALDAFRQSLGRPLHIQSGYRDPAYNKKVGGASNSQHLYGKAADIEPNLPSEAWVRGFRSISGIGIRAGDGTIAHVDVRHVEPDTNPTQSSPVNPARWKYE